MRGIAVTSHVSPTIISSKSRGNGSVSSFKVTGTKNRKKWGFRQCYVIKFVYNGLHCPNSIISFVWDYTGYIYISPWLFFSKFWAACVLNLMTRKMVKNEVSPVLCNQIRSWWTKVFRFHPFVCVALQWHRKEAPWPYISKVGSSGVSSFQLKGKKIVKNEVSPLPCNQIRSWWAILFRFYPCIRVTLQWHRVKAPWPIFSKVGEVGVPVFNWKEP